MLAFLGFPGPVELMIIGVMLLVPVAIVVALIRSRKPLGNNPNLRPCPDCGRFVSLRATTCPQCGCPLQG